MAPGVEHYGWLKALSGFLRAIFGRLATAITRRKPKLHVEPNVATCVWSAGTQLPKVELMQIVCLANVNHDDPDNALVIMDVYPAGTHSQINKTCVVVIPPNTMVRDQLSALVTPVIGKRGQDWEGKLVLVDQFHRKHETQKIKFKWVEPTQMPPM